MRSLLTGRSPNAFAMLLSMSLLLVAAISAATGFRADIFVLASYSVAIFHGWRYKRPGLADTLHIEGSGVPAYVQIRDQVLKAIGAGIIKPGEKMPTMRQVA